MPYEKIIVYVYRKLPLKQNACIEKRHSIVSAEHNEPSPASNANDRRPSSELWGSWDLPEEDTQPRLAASHPTPPSTNEQQHHPQQPPSEHFLHPTHEPTPLLPL